MAPKQLSTKVKLELITQARTRVWAIALAHVVCAPAASAYYSFKQGNPVPFAAATGLAIIGLPLALIDLGLTSFVIAPVVSGFLLGAKAVEARRKLGNVTVEEADELDENCEVQSSSRVVRTNITGDSF